MRRMRDVIVAAGERFYWRPAKPMPCEVERADRHAPVDEPHVRQFARERCGQPILPRAREGGNLVAAGSGERARHLVNVFADAGAGPQGRTIIDDDPHAAESITTRPYPCWSMGWKDILSPFGCCSASSERAQRVEGSHHE